MLVERSQTDFVSSLQIAWHYSYAGQHDKSLDWLEKAFDARDPGMPYIGAIPTHHPLRGNPRYEALLERMGLTRWMQQSNRTE